MDERGLQRDDCVVWLASIDMYCGSHAAVLDEAEVRRREAYVREQDRARFTLGAAMLRLAAAHELALDPAEVPIDRTCSGCGKPHGKPRIHHSGLYVSVSHSQHLVGVAITSAGEVGLDVEAVGAFEVDQALRRACLGPGEPLRVPEDFFVYWCRKESVVKATGDGLKVPMTEVTVTPADEPARLLSYAGSPLAAALCDLDVERGYAGAVAVLVDHDVAVDVRQAGQLLAPV